MKRMTCAWLMCILFVMGLCPGSAVAEDNVYFTAVDVYMQEVTDETMPFWQGGYLYVDSRIFSGLVMEYGTLYHSRNISKQTLALYSSKNVRSMVFYLDTGVTVDGTGRTYHAQAVVKGDVVFVPIAIVANFFELRYSTVKVNHGTLVRLTAEQEPLLSDEIFADAAADWIEVRYEEYLKTKTTTTTTTTPATPTTTPPEEEEGQIIHLALQVDADSDVQEWLDILYRKNAQATFFFTVDMLEDQGDLLRQILVKDHRIGLIADGLSETSVEDQLRQGNDLLYQATLSTSRLAWLVNVEDSQVVEDAGYCPISAPVEIESLITANGASITMAKIDDQASLVTVWLGSQVSAVGLETLLSYGTASNDQFRALHQLVAQ